MNDSILIDYIQKWGNAASIALFDPACKKFSLATIPGIIGYRDTQKCVVVFGDPVCPPEYLAQLTHAFHTFCSQYNKTIIYVATSEKFMQWIIAQKKNWSAIEIGNEIILDPCQDPTARTGSHASLLRNKYNQALRNGIIIKEYSEFDHALELKLEQVSTAWFTNRKGPQIHFGQNNIFADRANKRWFYAECNGDILGLLILNRIDAYQGWVQNLLMITPEAPKFISEVILLSTLEALRKEGCTFLSIGTLPSPHIGKIEGLGLISQWVVRNIYHVSKKIFKLGQRQRFWKKFEPRSKPTFVICSSSRIGISEILGIMNAFNAKIRNKKLECLTKK